MNTFLRESHSFIFFPQYLRQKPSIFRNSKTGSCILHRIRWSNSVHSRPPLQMQVWSASNSISFTSQEETANLLNRRKSGLQNWVGHGGKQKNPSKLESHIAASSHFTELSQNIELTKTYTFHSTCFMTYRIFSNLIRTRI